MSMPMKKALRDVCAYCRKYPCRACVIRHWPGAPGQWNYMLLIIVCFLALYSAGVM
jgi:hypothetical protein